MSKRIGIAINLQTGQVVVTDITELNSMFLKGYLEYQNYAFAGTFKQQSAPVVGIYPQPTIDS